MMIIFRLGSKMRAQRATLEAVVRREARIAPTESDVSVAQKIDGYFMPLYQWIDQVVRQTKSSPSRAPPRPCVCIGLSCVQGGGKTTATKVLREMFHATGRRCAVVSLDDVYLTRKEQLEVAAANASNPLLQHRGNPGTHDLSLLEKLIEQSQCSSGPVQVPRYDKSLHEGHGDRVPQADWEAIEAPLDVLIIEGWCLGFRTLISTDRLEPHLLPVNQALLEFEELYSALDALVVVKVETPQWVYRWREEQEAHLRGAGKPALSPTQVRNFVDCFMPAYTAYLPGLYTLPPAELAASSLCHASHLDQIPTLHLEIDVTRSPSSISPPVEINSHSRSLHPNPQ